MNARSNAPSLPTELTDAVLIFAIRTQLQSTFDYRLKSNDLGRIHTLLTAMDPSGHRSALLRAVLTQAWWIDVDWAGDRSALDLLSAMVSLDRAGHRPLQYSQRGIDRIASKGNFKVLDCLYLDELDMRFECVAPEHIGAGIVAAAGTEGWIWTLKRHFPLIEPSEAKAVVRAVVSRAVKADRHDLLQVVGKYLKNHNLGGCIIFPPNRDLVQLAAQRKDIFSAHWLLQNGNFNADWWRLHILLGSLASGDALWVACCFAQWWEPHFKQLRRLCYFDIEDTIAHFVDPMIPLEDMLNIASQHGHLELVQWALATFSHTIKGECLIYMDEIALRGHRHVLVWWTEVGVVVESPRIRLVSKTGNIVCRLTQRRMPDIVKWWVTKTALPYQGGAGPVVAAARHGNVELLQWWDEQSRLSSESGIRAHFGAEALMSASVNGHIHVLDWWVQNGKPIPDTLTIRMLKAVCRAGRINVLDWWYKHPSTRSVWSDANRINQLIQSSVGTQMQVCDWLCNVSLAPLSWPVELYFGRSRTIQPVLAKHYFHRFGSKVTLTEDAMVGIITRCMRRGQLLVLHDLLKLGGGVGTRLLRTCKQLLSGELPIYHFRYLSRAGWHVYDYLIVKHGCKFVCSKHTLSRLVNALAFGVLDWLASHHDNVKVEMAPMHKVVKHLSDQARANDEVSEWIERQKQRQQELAKR